MTEGYNFHFIDSVDMTAIASSVTELFGVPRSSILVRAWEVDKFVTIGQEVVGVPTVLIEHNPPIDGDYISFSGGEEFTVLTGNLSELLVASQVCRLVRSRAILPAKGVVSDALWVLVAPDGSSGLVVVDLDDLDEGVFTITGAVQRIPGAPEIPVVDPPSGLTS